jgi:hypothetical protein
MPVVHMIGHGHAQAKYWNRIVFCKSTISVYARDFKINAAIGFTIAAGDAFAAIKIRHDGYNVAFLKIRRISYLHNFACEFMSKHTRIFEIWLSAFKGMKVGATYTDASDLYDRMIL